MLRTMHVSHVQSKLYRSRFQRASSARASRLAPQEAAQELSKRTGETTIFVESEDRSTGVSRGSATGAAIRVSPERFLDYTNR